MGALVRSSHAGRYSNIGLQTLASRTVLKASIRQILGDLVFLSGDHMNIGMDCAWFTTLESAVRESMAWDGPVPPNYEIP